MEELKAKIKDATARAYSLKTKKAREKAFKVVRELRHEALMILYKERDAFKTHSVKGEVIVDNSHCMADYIMVRTPYGIMHASPTGDVLSKSWYAHTCCVKYTKGQTVVLEIEVDVQGDDLHLAVYPKRIYGGTLDEVQYAELCKRDDLAFFKYPGADGVTGLFKQTKGA